MKDERDNVIESLEDEIHELKCIMAAGHHDLSAILLRVEIQDGFKITDRDWETLSILADELNP